MLAGREGDCSTDGLGGGVPHQAHPLSGSATRLALVMAAPPCALCVAQAARRRSSGASNGCPSDSGSRCSTVARCSGLGSFGRSWRPQGWPSSASIRHRQPSRFRTASRSLRQALVEPFAHPALIGPGRSRSTRPGPGGWTWTRTWPPGCPW
jgi:hypothetical protein